MFGHPNNVHYNKSMRLYDGEDKFSMLLEAEEIVAYGIIGILTFFAFILASIF